MTENKRFCIEESILKEGLVIRDKEQEYSFPVLGSGMNFMFNKALNELYDENKQLKQSYKEFEDECQSTFNAMSRKQNDLYRKNFKLKEENEQLKSELSKKQEHIVLLENKIHRMREAIHKLEWLATHRNADLQRENWQLKQRCKELRNDLIDHSALIKMLEDAKALDIEDMIWNTMGYRTQTEFDDDFTNCREDAKKRWKE